MSRVENISLSRRGFLKASGIAVGGLVVGTSISACSSAPKPIPYAKDFQPNAFIQITADGDILFLVPNAEMGQGAQMGLTTLVAEELNTNPALIETRFAGFHEDYGMPSSGLQITGGSASIKERFVPLREAAATTREILLIAAAKVLDLPKSELAMSNGKITHGASVYGLGQFIDEASRTPVPGKVTVKPASAFKWVGKDKTSRTDALAKVTGTAEFGIDVAVEGARTAVVVSSPVIGGEVKGMDASEVKNMSGIRHVVTVFNGVAIVADSYWQARKAADKLQVSWQGTSLSAYSDDDIERALDVALKEEDGLEAFSQGDGREALDTAHRVIKARYKAPYLAHATMEPMNCTVQISQGKMQIWIPTQAPGMAAQVASEYSGISREDITVHSTFLGGGFGRRAMHDYLGQATQIAMQTGEVIKLVWSREDDMQNDYYRPISWADFEAGLDESGNLVSWNVKRAGPNIMPYLIDEAFGLMLPEFMPDGLVEWMSKRPYGVFKNWTPDHSSVEGLYEDYSVPHKEVNHVTVDPGLRSGAWRSVGHSYSGFFKESFIDELAHESGSDPLTYRLKHLGDNSRLKNTLELAAQKAGWPKVKPGRYLGLATHSSFESYVAQVAEVSVNNGQIRVHKVICVVDCGVAVNPDVVKAQMEGGLIFGLSAALHQKITLKNGAVEQGNFDTFTTLRMQESPDIEVIIVDSTEAPTGVGEPGTPPIAAAVANAVFAASGQRLRELPLRLV